MNKTLRLGDLGERRIIEDILRPRYAVAGTPRFGDDCSLVAHASALEGTVVATTDPCPVPVAEALGFHDLYYWGWLLATINLSDLAAAGSRPIGLLTSLTLPSDLSVEQFVRLLDGIDACCGRCGTRVLGGNIREGKGLELTATAIGCCAPGTCMSRVGCRQGDLITVVGDLGLFWAGALAVRAGLLPAVADHQVLLGNLLTPLPKVEVARAIAQDCLFTACMDVSDGLYASLAQLATANGVAMHVNMEKASFPPEVSLVCGRLGLDPVRLALGWGDWQLIGCVAPSRAAELEEVCRRRGTPVHFVGQVEAGHRVTLEHRGHVADMAPIDSQRFTRTSYMSAGLESYIAALIEGPLWTHVADSPARVG